MRGTGGTSGGILYHNSRVRLVDIRDGTAQTILVGERNSNVDYSTWVGVVHGVPHAVARIVGSTMQPPNSEPESFESFSSQHPGQTIFLFADGSVRGIKDEIDARVFHAMGTRAANEIIDGAALE